MSPSHAAALRVAVSCTRPVGAESGGTAVRPRCEGCGLSAKAMVYQVAQQAPHPRWRGGWRVREVWSALAAAEADLETVWFLPDGRSWRSARFCARCAPAGDLWSPKCAGCGIDGGGPIVVLGAEALPGMPTDDRVREQAVSYLQRRGWTISAGVLRRCPECS
jgi:hypothetical protein